MYCVDVFDLRVRHERGRGVNHSEDDSDLKIFGGTCNGRAKLCNTKREGVMTERGDWNMEQGVGTWKG